MQQVLYWLYKLGSDMRYAIIEQGLVVNVVITDDPGAIQGVLVQSDVANVGDAYNAETGTFTAPQMLQREPRWIALAQLIERLNPYLPAIESIILGNGSPPDVALSILKTRLMATSAEYPGYINLDAAEISDGLDALISGWGAQIGFDAAAKAAILE